MLSCEIVSWFLRGCGPWCACVVWCGAMWCVYVACGTCSVQQLTHGSSTCACISGCRSMLASKQSNTIRDADFGVRDRSTRTHMLSQAVQHRPAPVPPIAPPKASHRVRLASYYLPNEQSHTALPLRVEMHTSIIACATIIDRVVPYAARLENVSEPNLLHM
jgi:hypothetical protein